MVYEELKNKFEDLNDDDKNALLIYKSRLGRAINSLDIEEKEVVDVYNKYKRLLSNPANMFMSFTVFKDVSFSSLDSFKESLINIKKKVMNINLTLDEDTTVYRAFSLSDDSEEELLSKSELISTSLDIDTCDDFLVAGNSRHYLYQINLKKGSKVAICPYAILLDSKSDRLILSKSHDQEEILLNKENYSFDIVKTTTKELDNNEKLIIRVLDSETLEKTNTKKV